MGQIEIIPEVTRVLLLEGQAILACAERLKDPGIAKSIQKAVQAMQTSLEQGGKIVVTGLGKSGKIGQKIAATLCSTGSLAVFLHPTEGLHGDLGVVRPQDSVLILSYTGNTEEVVRLLPSLKALGVTRIGLGGNSHSKLAMGCDAWVDASVEQEACPLNSAPTTSTTLALALGDAIAVALMQLRGFGAEDFAQNHPGGSLGKKLNFRVQDLMHQGDDVPCVTAQAGMEEVVVISTRKKLGAVLVVDGKRLLGIITDGDIRRALQHREKFFDLKAEEVMTRNPTAALPEMMALAALRLMEDRPSQISILPVIDSNGNWKGLIRLHDLVRSF
jgi:arabinose-5-phosphate isomerase